MIYRSIIFVAANRREKKNIKFERFVLNIKKEDEKKAEENIK